jgi:hypothetical protein
MTPQISGQWPAALALSLPLPFNTFGQCANEEWMKEELRNLSLITARLL